MSFSIGLGLSVTKQFASARSGAFVLAGTEADVLAVDFSDLSCIIRDTGTPANNFNGLVTSKLTYTAPSAKWIRGADGLFSSASTLRTEYSAAGVALGVRCEEARTNRVLHNRDLTNAAWTKTSTTAAKDQIGIDGAANSASSLTATGSNGTCLQSITSGSAARITSAFVKRLVGTGTVELTQNNGTTWTAVTGSVGASWARVNVPSATVTNPIVGFRLGTSGDSIAVDFVQEESGAFITSPIATTTATVTRAIDNINLATSAAPTIGAAMTMFASCLPTDQLAATGRSLFIMQTTAANQVLLQFRSSSLDDYNVVLTRASVNEIAIAGGSISASVLNKVALGVAANDAAAYAGGASLGTDATCQVPSGLTTIYFGNVGAGQALNGWLKQALYVPRRMSNAELGAITT